MNPFRNESFEHAVARLAKGVIKRKVKGGAKTFEKSKKEMEGIDIVVN